MIPGLHKIFRQRPTLPHSRPCSTIGAEELNFRVRDGNGCFLFAIATEKNIYKRLQVQRSPFRVTLPNAMPQYLQTGQSSSISNLEPWNFEPE